MLNSPELVKVSGDYFEFYLDGEMVYDFDPKTTADSLRWIEHLAQKTWITKEHLGQFSRLAANRFGVRYI